MAHPLVELLRQIQNADEDTNCEELYEQIATGIEGQAQTVLDHQNTIETLNKDMTDLKAKNFDLFMKIPTTEKPAGSTQEGEGDEKPIMIDDLFVKKDGE